MISSVFILTIIIKLSIEQSNYNDGWIPISNPYSLQRKLSPRILNLQQSEQTFNNRNIKRKENNVFFGPDYHRRPELQTHQQKQHQYYQQQYPVLVQLLPKAQIPTILNNANTNQQNAYQLQKYVLYQNTQPSKNIPLTQQSQINIPQRSINIAQQQQQLKPLLSEQQKLPLFNFGYNKPFTSNSNTNYANQYQDDLKEKNVPTSITKENVQLLYVPIESLKPQHQQHQAPYQEFKFQEIEQFLKQGLPEYLTRTSTTEHPTTTIASTTTTTVTSPPITEAMKPHQPPLALYFKYYDTNDVNMNTILEILNNERLIHIQDKFEPNYPTVFIGPKYLNRQRNYAKFDLPYLSDLDIDQFMQFPYQFPIFVAPYSFKAPDGFIKISFPQPHIGSLIVKEHIPHLKQERTINNRQSSRKQESSNQLNNQDKQQSTQKSLVDESNSRTKQHSLVTSNLPDLINSLQDQTLKEILLSTILPLNQTYFSQLINEFKTTPIDVQTTTPISTTKETVRPRRPLRNRQRTTATTTTNASTVTKRYPSHYRKRQRTTTTTTTTTTESPQSPINNSPEEDYNINKNYPEEHIYNSIDIGKKNKYQKSSLEPQVEINQQIPTIALVEVSTAKDIDKIPQKFFYQKSDEVNFDQYPENETIAANFNPYSSPVPILHTQSNALKQFYTLQPNVVTRHSGETGYLPINIETTESTKDMYSFYRSPSVYTEDETATSPSNLPTNRPIKNRYRSKFRRPEKIEQLDYAGTGYELNNFGVKVATNVEEIADESQWAPSIYNTIDEKLKTVNGKKRKGYWRLVKTKPMSAINSTLKKKESNESLINTNFEFNEKEIISTLAPRDNMQETLEKIDRIDDNLDDVTLDKGKSNEDGTLTKNVNEVKTLYSKEISREMEICYRGRCIKSNI